MKNYVRLTLKQHEIDAVISLIGVRLVHLVEPPDDHTSKFAVEILYDDAETIVLWNPFKAEEFSRKSIDTLSYIQKALTGE
jgi:hypothetical protein